MYCRFRWFPALAALLLSACARQPAGPRVERIAILRFENLGPSVAGDWMGRAFSAVVTARIGCPTKSSQAAKV